MADTKKEDDNVLQSAIISLIVVGLLWYFADGLFAPLGGWRYALYAFMFFVGVGYASKKDNEIKAYRNLAKNKDEDIFECKYCGKEYKTEKGMIRHEEACKEK